MLVKARSTENPTEDKKMDALSKREWDFIFLLRTLDDRQIETISRCLEVFSQTSK